MTTITPGCRQDLEFYLNYPVVSFPFEILDDDGAAYDFTGFKDFVWKLFEKKHGTLVLTMKETDNEIERSSNTITLSVTQTEMSLLRVKEYYQEMYWVNASDQEILLFHGVGKAI